jgi:ubiquinone/menaquinone biosynthesis C-methylase UbiE
MHKKNNLRNRKSFLGSRNAEIVGGVRHEDAAKLSFADEQFDYIMSNDFYQHVGDFIKGFEEVV